MSSPSKKSGAQGLRVAGLRHGEARGAQRAREPDERQADERRRVLTFDAFEERDPRAFRLEASGTLERALTGDVAFDLVSGERAYEHRCRVHMSEAYPGVYSQHGARGVEARGATAQERQLCAAARRIARLVQQLLPAGCNLIAADDYGIGVLARNRLRFFVCQPQCSVRVGLPVQVIFGYPRCEHLKRQPQPREKLAAVAGSRGEDEGRLHARKQWLSRKTDFDLDRVATYYTRPMSSPWSRPLEVDRLADGGVDVDFAVPLAELTSLRSVRPGLTGQVSGRVHFAREQGVAVARLAMKGTAILECQRCMKPLELALDTHVRVGLVGSETEAGRVPADLETMLAPDGRIGLGELITEELLLTLPSVALHGEGDECVAPPAPLAARSEPEGETHKPFARLGELLKR